MNSISPVPIIVEPVADERPEWQRQIDSDTVFPDEETIPEGVALLLAAFEPSPRSRRHPGARSMLAAGREANLDSPAEVEGTPKIADRAAIPKHAARGDGGLPTGEGDAVRIEASPRDGLGAPPVQGEAVEERPVPGGDDGLASAEGGQEEAVLRVAAEFPQGIAQARSEVQPPLAQAFSEGAADERPAMSGEHEEAPPEPREQDDEASGDFLQVPFHNQRAQGQVLVSRDQSTASGWLIRATDRRVFEQLRAHFDPAGQPRWRLGGVFANDGTRAP